jgi:hypothetical protein
VHVENHGGLRIPGDTFRLATQLVHVPRCKLCCCCFTRVVHEL